MTWIRTIAPGEAPPDLHAVFEQITGARGGLAAVHQAQSLNPRALLAHLELYRAVMFARSPLSRSDRERIAVVVSAANRCPYCVAHHAEALRQLGDEPAVIAALTAGRLPEALSDRERALLEWSQLAASSPADCSEAGVQALLAAGYEDRAILDATLTVAYFSFVNRLVLCLGVDLEDGYERTCRDGSG